MTDSSAATGLPAGLDHEWSLEQYGVLLEIGGGKERMCAGLAGVVWEMGCFQHRRWA